MRIILFADRLPPLIGGMETHAHYFVKYFRNKFKLTIISRLKDRDVLVDDKYQFIKYIDVCDFLSQIKDEKVVLFFNSGRWIEQLNAIREILPDAIITYRTGGNEIIQAPLSFDMPNYKERKEYWKSTINGTVNFLVTNSSYTDNRLIDLGINPKILRRIAGGVDDEGIRKAMLLRDLTRIKYGISDSEKLCVCCARFVPYKRIDFLLQALESCKTPITLLLAGDGPLEEQVKSIAAEQHYPVRFIGRLAQQDSLELIAAADVYVQASCDYERAVEGGSYIHTEGMGRSLLEAICSGVPVVVTECGAVGEYINEENGILVNSKEEMAVSVDCILDSERTDKKEEYIKLYSFDKIFEEYITLWK